MRYLPDSLHTSRGKQSFGTNPPGRIVLVANGDAGNSDAKRQIDWRFEESG
jgi:hypothetical protein